MLDQRARQVERGTAADALQPEWCRQNEALCYLRVQWDDIVRNTNQLEYGSFVCLHSL